MVYRKRPDDKIHASGRPATDVMCGIRVEGPQTTEDWRDVTCMSCLCEIVDVIQARVARAMDGPWSGSGRRTRPNQGRKDNQMEDDGE